MLAALEQIPNENDRHTSNIVFIKKKYWIHNLQAGQEAMQVKNFIEAVARFVKSH